MSVAFDAATNGASGFASNFSWSHTATAGAYVIVVVSFQAGGSTPTVATYGGTAMTLLHTDSASQTYLYSISNVAGGTKTIVITPLYSCWSSTASASYNGVGSVGTVTAQTGTGTTASTGSVAAPAGGIMVAALASGGNYSNQSITATSGGTNRALVTSGWSATCAISDTAATDTLTATISTSSPWAAITIPLIRMNTILGISSITGVATITL